MNDDVWCSAIATFQLAHSGKDSESCLVQEEGVVGYIYAKIYNSLPDLDEADRALRAHSDPEVVNKILNVIAASGLSDRVGIRLLHHHNDVEDEEVMVEDLMIDERGFSLVTRPVPAKQLNENYVANSWVSSVTGFLPIEFSHKDAVADPNVNPNSEAGGFDSIARVLREVGLSSVLGPSLLGSAKIENERPEGASVMIETSDDIRRANILRYLVNDPSQRVPVGTSIQTHWCFARSETGTTAVRKCTKICTSVGSPPRHSGNYQHNSSND